MEYRSGWNAFASIRFVPHKLCFRVREVLSVLEREGVSLPTGNRIERALRRVEAMNEPGVIQMAAEEELRLASEAFRTLWEFFFIGYTWRERRRAHSPIVASKLALLLEGSDAPDLDANTRSRDTQFEMYSAASFLLGGADVKGGEPDWMFLYHGNYVGVAAKRVSALTTNAVRRAVRDAVRQIRNSTGTGFVALNVDSRVQHQESNSADDVGSHFNAVVLEAHNELDSRSDRPALLGALLFGTSFSWNTDSAVPFIEFQMPYQVKCFTKSSEDVDRSREFFDPLEQRISRAIEFLSPLVR